VLKMNELYNMDCMEGMREMKDNSVDFTLTDIPYDAVNRSSNGLRNLNKEKADIMLFELNEFLGEVLRVTKNSICIFCGKEQFSGIYDFFANQKGTVRPIIWEKTNPSPMNGQYIYLSGVEMAVWFKKSGAKTFNAYCKNTVFRYPNGKKEIHPTQKNIDLFKQLIIENTNKGDVVFDPCSGSATTEIAAIYLQRQYIGFEIDKNYYMAAKERLEVAKNQVSLFVK
jgi:DNA modification methylase